MVESVPSMFWSCFSRRFLRFKCCRAAAGGGEKDRKREEVRQRRKGHGGVAGRRRIEDFKVAGTTLCCTF